MLPAGVVSAYFFTEMDTNSIDTSAFYVILLDAFIDEFGKWTTDTVNHTYPPVHDGVGQSVMEAIFGTGLGSSGNCRKR